MGRRDVAGNCQELLRRYLSIGVGRWRLWRVRQPDALG